MIKAVIMDTTPLGLASQRPGRSVSVDACITWLEGLDSAGIAVYIPEIADYEVRRELLRVNATEGLVRLDRLKATARFIPITTNAMLRAAQMWADIRNAGMATADKQALDGDVILCAQALELGLPISDLIVATSNANHIRRYLNADEWREIVP